MLAHGIVQRLAASLKFIFQLALRSPYQFGMSVGVVSDHVSGGRNAPRDIGALRDEASNEKKSRLNVVLAEHVEQMQRVRVIGTIIVCQRKLARIRAAGNRCAKQLRLRRHGAIGIDSCSAGCGAGGNQQWQHGEIVIEEET